MKKCSCGKIYFRVPKNSLAALDAIVPGYYFNCICKSTLIFPFEKKPPPGVLDLRQIATFILMILALSMLAMFFTGCGAKNAGSSSSTDCTAEKSVFSSWSDDGGNSINFSAIQGFNQPVNIQEIVAGITCTGSVSAAGDQNTGTITVSGAHADPSILTNICDQLNGSFDYSRANCNLVIGKVGSGQPIEYH